MSAVDKSSMGRFMSSEGTDAATANIIAGAVSDVWRAHFGNEWVPFSVRYGIAHEVQRRFAQRSTDPTHDCESCEACLHDGHKCCGCYDGACCKPGVPESADA